MYTIPRAHRTLSADARIEEIAATCKKQFAPSTADALLNAFAMFSLKEPSFLSFQEHIQHQNLAEVFHITRVYSDTHIRRLLDEVDPHTLRPLFTTVFKQIQRSGKLQERVFYDGHYLIANDGTTYHSSTKVSCDSCLCKKHRNGVTEHSHACLGSVIVHPEYRTVFPLCPEPIQNTDGHTKNDCEQRASERWVAHFRREHPKLKAIVTEDALSATAPHIQLLAAHNLRFILRVKEKRHSVLFDYTDGFTEVHTDTATYRYRNGVSLNAAHPDVLVNLMHCTETVDGTTRHFSWITDIPITEENVVLLCRGGRTRWKIENETFNTLKNQGYTLEHNFGHGSHHLASVFLFLTFLAFLVDQVQEAYCSLFQELRAHLSSRRSLWDKLRNCFMLVCINSMAELFTIILTRKREMQMGV
jgi:hypothetical protein